MSKFKVGDKVRVRKDLKYNFVYYMEDKSDSDSIVRDMEGVFGKEVSIIGMNSTGRKYLVEGGKGFSFTDEMFEQPRREFIVIRRDGAKTIAELRHDREVIKSGTATCNASDTFDFNTGAKLAFDRLMGREEPKPELKKFFSVGDRVETSIGHGKIIKVDPEDKKGKPYWIEYDNGYCYWKNSAEAKPEPNSAPAPEPPKFYTGKVVMVDCEFPDRKHLINHLFEFKDGRQVGNKMHGMSFNHAPYTSFEQIVSIHNASTWIEVKE